jgi:hypothetical protein
MGARKQPRDLHAEAEAAVARAEEDARARAARRRFDPRAMVGHPLEEARAYYLAQGFPVVMTERAGGGSVLSLMRERVRLVVDADGIVVDAYLA